MDRCIEEIVKASNGALTKEDLQPKSGDGIFDDVERRVNKYLRTNPTASKEEAALAVGKELAQAERLQAIIEKRQRAINVLRKKERFAVYEANKDKEAAIRSMLGGRTDGGWGAAKSVDAMGKKLKGDLINPMMRQLDRAGLLPLFRDRGFEDQVAAEIWRLSDPDNPNLPKTTSKEAKEAARIIGQATEMGRVTQNKEGAWIGKLPGYVMRQDHDMIRIRRAGQEKWQADFLAMVDMEKTFDDPTDVKAVQSYLNYLYNSLQTGVHEGSRGADDWLMGFKGPANKAKKLSSHRSIHFKGPAEMMAYHRLYGRGSLMESVIHGLEKAGENTALMRVFGTNPQAAFDADVTQLADAAAQAGDTKNSDKLRANWWTNALFRQVNGTANIGGNPTIAAVSSFARGWQTLASLGQITVSAITDIPLVAGTLRYGGLSYFEGLSNQLASLFEGRTTAEQLGLLDQLGVMLDGTVGDFGARFTSDDGARGYMAKTLQWFFKYGGIRWWTDRMRAGAGLGASWKLAQLSTQQWDKLPLQLRANFERYQIGAKEWDVIRQADLAEGKGRKYLTSDGVKTVPDDAIRAYLGKPDAKPGEIEAARETLATNLGIYFTDLVDEAVNQPGAFERAVTSGGSLPSGTIPGEVARAFMQFKGFGISAARRHFWREVTRTGQIDKAGLFYLMIGTTAMGYAAMQLKAMVNGKTPQAIPESFADVRQQVLAAFLQGGGAGIYGDFLFGDTNRYGRDPLVTLAGPQVGTISDLMKIKGEIFDADQARDWKRIGADSIRLVKQNLPFQNFLWTKQAADYLLFYGLQEMTNPGYLRRMESRIRDENQQTFMFPPSQYATRF